MKLLIPGMVLVGTVIQMATSLYDLAKAKRPAIEHRDAEVQLRREAPRWRRPLVARQLRKMREPEMRREILHMQAVLVSLGDQRLSASAPRWRCTKPSEADGLPGARRRVRVARVLPRSRGSAAGPGSVPVRLASIRRGTAS